VRPLNAGVRRRKVLIVLLDEPGLFVFPSMADAVRDIEPIDAEREIRAAYDEYGVPYTVEWVRRNRHRKFLFGLFHSVVPGDYRLVPAGPADPAALLRLLESHPLASPPEAKSNLESVHAKLRAV
jgi:hypothetical protein